MHLLLSRDQKAGSFSLIPPRIGGGVTFTLTAQLQLEPHEMELLKRYALLSSPIIVSNLLEDIKNALKPSWVLGFIAGAISGLVLPVHLSMLFGVFITLLMTAIYFEKLRENLTVDQLLENGRTFYCFSVRELIEKEAYLEGACSYLRQLLESAKHWGDREAIPIPPLDREAAKQAVLHAS